MAEIHYHLDEHIDRAIAVGLRQRGIDVTTTTEVGLLNKADPHQISFATAEGRVFVTCDRGILREIPPGTSHSGIVIARSGRRYIGPIVLALVRLHRTTTAEEMVDRLEYVQ
jgi:uncharacterized protein with PIN domain